MKKHRDLLEIVINVAAVALVLILIVVGLNKMGLYNLPAPVEKLLGTYDGTDYTNSRDDTDIYQSIKDNAEKQTNVVVGELDYQNVRLMLEKVKPTKDYTQEVFVENIQTGALSKSITLVRQDGLYSADIFDNKNTLVKSISDMGNGFVEIVTYNDGEKTLTLPKGDFDISKECGVVLNQESFLQGGFQLDQSSFAVEQSELGVLVVITFETAIEDYTQTEKYWISLDYGIVVKA